MRFAAIQFPDPPAIQTIVRWQVPLKRALLQFLLHIFDLLSHPGASELVERFRLGHLAF